MEYEDDPSIKLDVEGTAPPEVAAPHIATKLEAPALKANLSAIASADVVDLETTASALGITQVSGDAHISTSWCGVVYAKQGGTFQQGYASTAIFGGDTTVKQAGAPIIVGRSMNIEQGGGALLVGSDVKVSRGFVGIVVSGRSEISDDSKVLIGTKAAIIIAAAILGGFAVVAVVMAIGTARIATWGRNIKMPDLPSRRDMQARWHDVQAVLQDVPARLQQLRKSA